MVAAPVSPCMVIQGPSGEQVSEVWGRFGMGG
jgi:hypothetical protein